MGEKSIYIVEDEYSATHAGENGISSVELSRLGNVVVEPEGYCA